MHIAVPAPTLIPVDSAVLAVLAQEEVLEEVLVESEAALAVLAVLAALVDQAVMAVSESDQDSEEDSDQVS